MSHSRCHPYSFAFLVPVRNPIERIQSCFHYEQNNALHECYKNSFSSLAAELETTTIAAPFPLDVSNMTCSQKAWAALMGARHIADHSYYNFQHYWQLQKIHLASSTTRIKKQPILAVRTDHILEDLNTIDAMVMGAHINNNNTLGQALATVSVNKGRHRGGNSSDELSPATHNTLLCRALCHDIQYYKRFLLAAVNLDADQVKQSIASLQAYCPEETFTLREDCHDYVPTIPRLLVD